MYLPNIYIYIFFQNKNQQSVTLDNKFISNENKFPNKSMTDFLFLFWKNYLLFEFYFHWTHDQDYLHLIFYIWIFKLSSLFCNFKYSM